jgi:hypothetical protein
VVRGRAAGHSPHGVNQVCASTGEGITVGRAVTGGSVAVAVSLGVSLGVAVAVSLGVAVGRSSSSGGASFGGGRTSGRSLGKSLQAGSALIRSRWS